MVDFLRALLLWLLALLTPDQVGQVQYGATPTQDFVGVVAAEAAYTTFAPEKPKPAPNIDPKNCPTCKGAGRIPTGDDQGWMKCPTCKGGKSELAPVSNLPPATVPQAIMRRP